MLEGGGGIAKHDIVRLFISHLNISEINEKSVTRGIGGKNHYEKAFVDFEQPQINACRNTHNTLTNPFLAISAYLLQKK